MGRGRAFKRLATGAFILGLLPLFYFASPVLAEDCSQVIKAENHLRWTPPTEGSPVEHYRLYFIPVESCDQAYELFTEHRNQNFVPTFSNDPEIHVSRLNLQPGPYQFAVLGVDAQGRLGRLSNFARPQGCSCYTFEEQATPIEQIPNPTNVTATPLSPKEIRLEWEAPSNVDGSLSFVVNIEEVPLNESNSGDAPPTPPVTQPAPCLGPESIPVGEQTFFAFRDLTPNRLHFIRVCTQSEDGLSTGTVLTEKTLSLPSFSVRSAPNPFNEKTTIFYSLETPGNVRIDIFNLRGQIVRHLLNAPHALGSYRTAWDGRNDIGETLPSGVYLIRVHTPDGPANQKVTLVK